MVTEADRASEELVRRLLADARPGDGFLGEEGHDDAGTTGIRWVVDPIDGTVNFLYGLPQYAVSVAAERDGESVAGVVLDVATGGRSAPPTTDGDACRDGRPLRRPGPAPLGQRLVGTGFSYEPTVRSLQAAAVGQLLPRVRDIRRFGSCALDLCAVAAGRLDGYVEEGANLWDHAAGALIARGGRRPRGCSTAGAGGGDLAGVRPGTRVRRAVGDRAGLRVRRSGPVPPRAALQGNSHPCTYCSRATRPRTGVHSRAPDGAQSARRRRRREMRAR